MKNKYDIIINYDKYDDIYLVTIPVLVGAVRMPCTEGKSWKDAAKSGEEILETFEDLLKPGLNPLAAAIETIVGRCPMKANPWLVGISDSIELREQDQEVLNDWINLAVAESTFIPWCTGVGALEAAEAIVHAAIENGNIVHLHGEWRQVQG